MVDVCTREGAMGVQGKGPYYGKLYVKLQYQGNIALILISCQRFLLFLL